MSRAELAALQVRLKGDGRPRPAFSVEDARANWYAHSEAYVVPPQIVVTQDEGVGRRMEWLRHAGSTGDRTVLFVHGGGYFCGSIESHHPLTAELAMIFDGAVVSLDYSLAPERPFPQGPNDVVDAYAYLLDKGRTPGTIALAGDSAGAGVLMSAIQMIRQRGLPLPAAAWCISPYTDLSVAGASIRENAARDTIVFVDALERSRALYLGDHPTSDPLGSPVKGDFTALPALLIQVGAPEILLDDAVSLARRAGACGVDVTLEIWPEMIHAWHLFAPELEEGRRAIAQGARWLQDRLHAKP